MWRVAATPVPGALVGRVILRRSGLRSRKGTRTWVVCGILGGAADAIPEARAFDGTRGDGRFAITPSTRAIVGPRPGSTGERVFQMTKWGWGREPVGLNSTMALRAQDAMDRGRDLVGEGDRTAEEEAEWNRIDRVTCGALSKPMRDERYARFLAAVERRRTGPRPMKPGPVTWAQATARGAEAERAVGEMMDEEDEGNRRSTTRP